jgi:hypothetical protein
MSTGSVPGIKSGRGMTPTPHPLLVPWSRKGRAIPLLSLWALRPVQSLRACTSALYSLLLEGDTVGSRTRDFPTCSAVPQPTAPPRTSSSMDTWRFICFPCKLLCLGVSASNYVTFIMATDQHVTALPACCCESHSQQPDAVASKVGISVNLLRCWRTYSLYTSPLLICRG